MGWEEERMERGGSKYRVEGGKVEVLIRRGRGIVVIIRSGGGGEKRK